MCKKCKKKKEEKKFLLRMMGFGRACKDCKVKYWKQNERKLLFFCLSINNIKSLHIRYYKLFHCDLLLSTFNYLGLLKEFVNKKSLLN